jgi:hypothetical protein
MCVLIKLESFNSKEVQEMFGMLCKRLLEGELPSTIVISTMQIFQEITTHALEL